MKANKKIILSILFLILFILLGCNKSNASDLYLNNLDFNAKINQDGSMDVTETWDISVEDTNTLFKTFKTDSKKYTSISNVQVTEVTGSSEKSFSQIESLMYHVTKDCYYGLKNDDGNFEIAWGVGLDDESANKIYKISYKVNDAIAKYNDYAELYWQFVGKDFEIDCKKVTGTIYLPQNASSKEDIKVWGHTEGLNGEIYATDLNKIEFEVNKFYSGRYIEIRSLFPTEIITNSNRIYSKNILDEVVSEETTWANEANLRREKAQKLKNLVSFVFIVICGILDVLIIKSGIKMLKKASEKTKIKPSNEIEYFRDVPRKNETPSQAVYVYKEMTGSMSTNQTGNIFSASLLDLCLKKYIGFVENANDSKNIIIKILKKEADDKLEKSERVVFEYLLGAAKGKDEITIKEIEKYMKNHASNLINLKDDIEKSTIRELEINGLYDAKEAEEKKNIDTTAMAFGILIIVILFIGIGMLPAFIYNINTKVVAIGVVSLIISCLIKAIATKRYSKKINVYTQKGIDEKQMWRGLKKYMEDFSMLDKREIPEIAIWEHFLVYATAFGIADKVIKQLKAVYKELGRSFDFDNSSMGYMYFMTNNNFSSSFTNSMSSAFTSAYQSNYSSSYSSGSGGGGGFSGGGGGGRRPVVGGGGR